MATSDEEWSKMSNYSVVNPATGETVEEYPEISDEDLSAAITAAEEPTGIGR